MRPPDRAACRHRSSAALAISLALSLTLGCAGPAPRSAPPPGTGEATANGYPRPGNPSHYEVFGRRYFVMNTAVGYRKRGVASWYGRKFHGRPTASGEIYDMYALTAAHKTLPLPTMAQVRNLQNGRSVVVRINDRGPFVDNRLIDLSYGAARELGLVEAGTGLVEVRTLAAAPPPPAGGDTPSQDGLPAVPTPAVASASAPDAGEPATTTAAGRPDPSDGGPTSGVSSARPGRADTHGGTAGALPAVPPAAASEIAELTASLLIDDALRIPPQGGPVFVQFGAFGDPVNAEHLRARLSGYGFENVHIARSDSRPAVFRVRIGPISDALAYDALIERIARFDIRDSFLTVD